MQALGTKIAAKRKDLGMTQTEFAESLSVTRQTVGRWETGVAVPDIDKISDIADILGVSCDYLLKDDHTEEGGTASANPVSRLLQDAVGRKVKLSFFYGEADIDLYDTVCTIEAFEGSWMKVNAETKKGAVEKLIPVSSILSLAYEEEDA